MALAEKNSAKTAKRKPRGKSFQKGQTGNPTGRPKGVPNKATQDIKAFCQELFRREEFQKNLIAQWDALTLDPSYRALLTHYAFGKPAQSVILDSNFDPAKYLARPDEADND